ncbi:CGCGG family rSAM-modified RiPP protein (plasmid) [Haloferax larsenii]|uniref:CGCGG family rSAM-modified RiPP protein n=1 Tax=Haloferax larsenii TaxID=302484 RepID=A0ABY5RJE1_HALLR|nr:CGCGG family rSAM-modified RiPP protein [Haloferax larsenii]UVE52269.1 CGCGG family rSAM-modified RiPP protein [Haloferax larsenii]
MTETTDGTRGTDETRGTHDTSWSANLEAPEHAESKDRVVTDALDAIERTESGCHVNLVTHANHGHPEEYLYPVIEREFDDVDVAFVDQCGCGGFVTRVYV